MIKSVSLKGLVERVDLPESAVEPFSGICGSLAIGFYATRETESQNKKLPVRKVVRTLDEFKEGRGTEE